MARVSLVASPLAILPPPPSWFRPLAPYCPLSWPHTAYLHAGRQPTATDRLAPDCCSPAGTLQPLLLGSPLYPLRSTRSSLVTPSRGIALPPWLPLKPWSKDVIFDATIVYGYGVGPHSSSFPLMRHHYPLPQPRVSRPQQNLVLFGVACGRFWVSLPVRVYELFPYVSGVLVSSVLQEGYFSYGLRVVNLSNEEVKRALVVTYRFFSLHSSRCIRPFVTTTNNA